MQLISSPLGPTYVFDYPGEMFRDMFMEMGLEVGSDGCIRDQETKNPLRFKDKYIKCSITPYPIYAGNTDVLLELQHSYSIIEKLFGYYLDYAQNTDDGDITGGMIGGFFIDELPDKSKQRVALKTRMRGEISSDYYFNTLLAFVDCIFKIAGTNVDLHNFDVDTRSKK